MKQCLQCGKPLCGLPTWKRGRIRKFCSRVCAIINWRLNHPEEYERRKREGLRASPKVKAHMKRLHSKERERKARLTRSKMPMFQSTEFHPEAKWWFLRSPRGQIYKFRNLVKFIRDHSDLFDPIDVVWIPAGTWGLKCRAYGGLAQLRSQHLSWKGWTWATNYTVAEEPSHDILERNQNV